MSVKWPAQPDNLATQQAVQMLEANAANLLYVAYQLRKRRGPKARGQLRRQLSGSLADVEIVRVAIKE